MGADRAETPYVAEDLVRAEEILSPLWSLNAYGAGEVRGVARRQWTEGFFAIEVRAHNLQSFMGRLAWKRRPTRDTDKGYQAPRAHCPMPPNLFFRFKAFRDDYIQAMNRQGPTQRYDEYLALKPDARADFRAEIAKTLFPHLFIALFRARSERVGEDIDGLDLLMPDEEGYEAQRALILDRMGVKE